MASKRLGSPFEEAPDATKKPRLEIPSINNADTISGITPQTATMPKEDNESLDTATKPRIEIPTMKAFCGVAGITPQTGTFPQQPQILTSAPPIDTTDDPRSAAYEKTLKYHTPSYHVWVAMEMWHPGEPSEDEKAMVKILGIFINLEVALEHAEEHTRALYTVTNYGVRTESEAEEDADKASEDLSPNSLFERRLEYFRGLWESEEEEGREDGGKKWTIRWGGNVTEVWVEEREVYESVEDAGFHTPLPLLGFDDRDP
jgi:hypothetical protein